MTFGPNNGPAVYTAMTRTMQDKWDLLFNEQKPEITTQAGTKESWTTLCFVAKQCGWVAYTSVACAKHTRNID